MSCGLSSPDMSNIRGNDSITTAETHHMVRHSHRQLFSFLFPLPPNSHPPPPHPRTPHRAKLRRAVGHRRPNPPRSLRSRSSEWRAFNCGVVVCRGSSPPIRGTFFVLLFGSAASICQRIFRGNFGLPVSCKTRMQFKRIRFFGACGSHRMRTLRNSWVEAQTLVLPAGATCYEQQCH